MSMKGEEYKTPELPKGYFFYVGPYYGCHTNKLSPFHVVVELRKQRRFWFSKLLSRDGCVGATEARIHAAMTDLLERSRSLLRTESMWGYYPPKKL